MTYLLQNWLDSCWIGSENISELGELGVLEQSSELTDAHLPSSSERDLLSLSLSGLRCLSLTDCFESGWDSVEEVLDCSFVVVECSSESSETLLSGESHCHKFSYLCLMFCILGGLFFCRLFVLLVFFLVFLFLIFGGFRLALFFGFWCWLSDLVHADHKIGVFDPYFLDSIIVIESFAFEDDLQGLSCHALDLLNFGFENGNLSEEGVTVSAGSTSTWKTSPLRFLILSFITT